MVDFLEASLDIQWLSPKRKFSWSKACFEFLDKLCGHARFRQILFQREENTGAGSIGWV
jgi:hypothetical protein